MGSLLDFSYREPEPPSGTPATFQDDAAFYAMERSGCRMYSHLGVHLNVLLLLLSLLCRPTQACGQGASSGQGTRGDPADGDVGGCLSR